MRCFKKAYISLGSNLGDRQKSLLTAGCEIENIPNLRVLRKTSILENHAVLYEDQPDFLNQIFEVETLLFPEELLSDLKKIEMDMGREKTFRYGPRSIDLDILSYGTVKRKTADLTLPHPGFYDRPYIRTLLQEFYLSPEVLFPHKVKLSENIAHHLPEYQTIAYGKQDG